MPLYDYECSTCQIQFEELAKQEEIINCPQCQIPSIKIVSKLADYHDGLQSRTIQYVNRKSPYAKLESHLTKCPDSPSFLSKPPININKKGERI